MLVRTTLFLMSVIVTANAQDTRYVPPPTEPYCGLYSAQAALRCMDIESDFDELCVSKNLSGEHGSTAEDLVRLLRHAGASGSHFAAHLTTEDLKAADSPVILHTSVVVSRTGYHHWILFLGMEGGKFRIYDPPAQQYQLSEAELLTQWDGHAVIVARGDPVASIPWWVRHKASLIGLVLTATLLVLFRPLESQCLRIAVAACLAGVVWHGVIGFGFVGNDFAKGAVASKYFRKDDFDDIAVEELSELMQNDRGVLIDARRRMIYADSHIPGAINVPINVTSGGLRAIQESIPTDEPIVVYCQSEKCQMADSIASQFAARGYSDVRVFRAGLEGWRKAQP